MKIHIVLSEYLEKKKQRCTPNTYHQYAHVLNLFFQDLDIEIEELNEDRLVTAWNNFITPKQVRPQTQRIYRGNIATFLNWCQDKKYIIGHSCRAIFIKPNEEADRPKVTKQQFLALLEAAKSLKTDLEIKQTEAILFIAYTALLRRSEISNIALTHLKLESDPPCLLVHNGKGGKSAWLPLSDQCAAAIRKWINVRPKLNHINLFCQCRRRFRPFTIRSLQYLFSKLAKIAGFDEAVIVPHAFRRGGSTLMHRSGVDIATVCKALRHSKISTTQVYVEADIHRLGEVRNWMDEGGFDGKQLALDFEATQAPVFEVHADPREKPRLVDGIGKDPRFRSAAPARRRLPPNKK